MLNLDGKDQGMGNLPFDENAMKDMEKLFGQIGKEMEQSGANPGASGQQPSADAGLDSMFKAFEKATQEHNSNAKKDAAGSGEDPLAAMLGALGGGDG